MLTGINRLAHEEIKKANTVNIQIPDFQKDTSKNGTYFWGVFKQQKPFEHQAKWSSISMLKVK